VSHGGGRDEGKERQRRRRRRRRREKGREREAVASSGTRESQEVKDRAMLSFQRRGDSQQTFEKASAMVGL
jgi:hypothetical protein